VPEPKYQISSKGESGKDGVTDSLHKMGGGGGGGGVKCINGDL